MLMRAFLIVVLVAALVWLAIRGYEWLTIDRCLDAGGRWDYERSTCERVE